MDIKEVAFYNSLNSKKLAGVSLPKTDKEEIKSILELLAYENNVRKVDINIVIE